MATRAELQAKADATQLKNLLAKKADKKPFTKWHETMLKRLSAQAQAK